MVWIKSNLIQPSHNNLLKWILFDFIETIKVSNKLHVEFSENLWRKALYTSGVGVGKTMHVGIYELGRN